MILKHFHIMIAYTQYNYMNALRCVARAGDGIIVRERGRTLINVESASVTV